METCNACEGTGEVTMGQKAGELRWLDTYVCPVCKGEGMVYDPDENMTLEQAIDQHRRRWNPEEE